MRCSLGGLTGSDRDHAINATGSHLDLARDDRFEGDHGDLCRLQRARCRECCQGRSQVLELRPVQVVAEG